MDTISVSDAQKKLEYYCSYQDRCHKEVTQKLYDLGVHPNDQDTIIVHLITNNYLNEERFARSFVRGKHRLKHWGFVRITNELKFRNIASPNIKLGLSEITQEEYLENFHKLAERQWETILEKNALKKKKKFCDYLLRKGWESQLVFAKANELDE